eukprot:TRINITY_DN12832_c0_g1_i2.p1 TRINITY_DN12832_c0_g1~~TRINITY_DN12832_c0_g1_i2.p1  ORF type:complete len:110 (+),score=9.26 TRINITY_DN12832_c0_g1_i2:242-571(+)
MPPESKGFYRRSETPARRETTMPLLQKISSLSSLPVIRERANLRVGSGTKDNKAKYSSQGTTKDSSTFGITSSYLIPSRGHVKTDSYIELKLGTERLKKLTIHDLHLGE